MTLLTFNGYGVNSVEQTIIAERITNFYLIDYNGNYGTEIILDTGKIIRVGVYPHDVAAALEGCSVGDSDE